MAKKDESNTATVQHGTADGEHAGGKRGFFRRLRLRHLLFLLLLFTGIIPLLLSSFRLIEVNRSILRDQETVLLTSSAKVLAEDLSDDLARRNEQLRQLGHGLVARGAVSDVESLLRAEWLMPYMARFQEYNPELVVLNVLSRDGVGVQIGSGRRLAAHVREALQASLGDAAREQSGLFRFVQLADQTPSAVVTVPVPVELLGDPDAASVDGGTPTPATDQIIIQGLFPLQLEALPVRENDADTESLMLVDGNGDLLWGRGDRPEIEAALLEAGVATDVSRLMSVTREYPLQIGTDEVSTLARLVGIDGTDWAVVAYKSTDVAFKEVERMAETTLVSSLILVLVAMIFALVAAEWLSQPFQRLAETTHEIAAGKLDRRVNPEGLAFEMASLADDFNRMGDYVANYVEQLQQAAKQNRQLFISTIRAFAATIDAKDPYTRGHSERVASYSRSIARYLGLPKDVQERVWVSAVLHDIGKIGVEDRILKKGGVLTPDEFEQMKMHTIIGADIVTPIAELRDMIPGIRWHHEAWNGSGYPDGLKAEQIPLMARIIGVADTFDAITTNRPYQSAYDTDYALKTIKKLAGAKFDAKIVTAFLLAYEAGHIEHARKKADSSTSERPLATPVAAAR
ncbi:MAG: HD domain-containing phosphohydrolase [Acidobacteriota bacterium]